ncbi:hypothetical protein [Cryobacterium breve]|uniref:hypothetical protein n=1 Tax=Cryobacterium breve TaxID=1259258 RepID=UPI00248D39E1|nr:hypothetical protein [Cryobacterium breve]
MATPRSPSNVPFRLTWALTPERLEVAVASKPLAKVAEQVRTALAPALSAAGPATSDAKAFTTSIKKILAAENLVVPAAQLKTLIAGLSERDETAPIVRDAKGIAIPDTDLRDTENVPLKDDIDAYIRREIAPHVEHFWVDRSKDKIGYEIPFTRHFYTCVPPRSLEDIDADLNELVQEITTLLAKVERA